MKEHIELASNCSKLGLAEERLHSAVTVPGLNLPNHESERYVHELQVRQIELEMQNEELRKAQDDRLKMENRLGRYSDLYDLAPVGYLLLDQVGIIREINIIGARFLGGIRSSTLNKRLDQFISNETRPLFHDFLGELFTTGTQQTCELVFLKEGDSQVIAQIEATVSDSREECRVVIVDITELRRAEAVQKAARSEAERYGAEMAALMDAVPAAIFIAHDVECLRMSGSLVSQKLLGLPATANFSRSAPLAEQPKGYCAMKEGREIPADQLPVQMAARGEEIRDFEFDFVFDDGSMRTVVGNAVPLFDQSDRPRGAIGAFIEITDRKQTANTLERVKAELESQVAQRTEELAGTIKNLRQEIIERGKAEERTRRLNRLNAVLSEINQAIARTKDRDTLFKDFCSIAVGDGGFKLAWVGLVDEESGQVEVAAADGAIGYLDGIEISAREKPSGFGPTGIAIRKGTYCLCNDFLDSQVTRPWHERARAHGIRSAASVALKQEGRVVGALNLYADKKNFFDRHQLALLQQVGADVSFALDNMVREARSLEAELALRNEITERLRVVESLREKEQMLVSQSRQAAMGEMIGNIAHQWRQPLNLLGLTAQQLLFYHDAGQLDRTFLSENVDKQMRLVEHMSDTIDDFRNYFKPDKGKMAFSVQEVIVKTLSLLHGSLHSPQISVEVIAKDASVIHGYPNEFAQVLLNLVSNAKDILTERKISAPKVIITTFSEEECTVVTVADNGGGISEAILDRIFDPYFTTKGSQQGTGIGLFMSKTIIEKSMQGRLAVRNIADGTEFRMQFYN